MESVVTVEVSASLSSVRIWRAASPDCRVGSSGRWQMAVLELLIEMNDCNDAGVEILW